jgi:DNA polymerase II large subunit
VQLLVEGLLNNSTPEELVELFGDKTSYETVRKRMNRRIKKYRAQDDSQ